MKKILFVLCLIAVMSVWSISTFSAPHPGPDTGNSIQMTIYDNQN